jgi:hypothetical protein
MFYAEKKGKIYSISVNTGDNFWFLFILKKAIARSDTQALLPLFSITCLFSPTCVLRKRFSFLICPKRYENFF